MKDTNALPDGSDLSALLIERNVLNRTTTNHLHIVNVRVFLDVIDGGSIWLAIKV
jgi:hypothetical protein